MRDCDVLGGLLRNFITGGPGSAGCARDFLNVRKVLEPKKATFPLLELYCVQAMVADTVARALRGMPVTDRRFGPAPELPSHVKLRSREVRVQRDGRVVRVFEVTVLARRAAA